MKNDIILLGHGSGGRLSHQLLDEVIIPILSQVERCGQNDAAILNGITGDQIAFTTDSYVVDPLIFPGGNIGDLAINGTVNDLAMSGARPLAISVGLILEEGLAMEDLCIILVAMKAAADRAQVKIVTGDTKVVPRGKGDKIFINTSGVGVFDHALRPAGHRAKPGDRVLINGGIGEHGMAVLASREGLDLQTPIVSDTAPLNFMVQELLARQGDAVHVLRDPTRGGVATTLKEIALQSAVDICLDESSLPINAAVAGACAILGLDPLFVANEGKLLAVVRADAATAALKTLHNCEFGAEARIIGEVIEPSAGRLMMRTSIGGLRALEMLAGEQLPRIC